MTNAMCYLVDGDQGGSISSKNHVNKLHSIFRYAESSWRITEIKHVIAHSIKVCGGINGDQCLKLLLFLG